MLKLADRLRGLRGIESQTAFAARFGLKQAIYSHYETGRKKPSLEVLMQMATVLGVSTDYLLGLSDSLTSAPSVSPREIKTGHINGGLNVFGDGNNITQTVGTPRKRKRRGGG